MCTVSYLPADGGFLLAANRDEDVHRSRALLPQSYRHAGQLLVFPRDPQGQGSWIAAAASGRVACLLNGALRRHQRRPPYRRSRGTVVLKYFESNHAVDFVRHCDLNGVEPFTLVMVDADRRLSELLWTGSEKHFRALEHEQPHQWSSVTLYDAALASRKRQLLFSRFSQEVPSAAALNDLHRCFFYEDWVAGPDKVDAVRTLSISVVHVRGQELIFDYEEVWPQPARRQQMRLALEASAMHSSTQ